jgi:hypothetical protein
MPGKKARIGDICELKTSAGLAYIQYTHDNKSMGQLVRVLPGLFDTRPADFATLAKCRELYFVFYTLTYALREGLAEIVSNQPVPDWAQPYPLMRWSPLGGIRDPWKIFNASRQLTPEEHRRTPLIYNLTPAQEKLSIDHLWPHPVMIKELARGWTPERAEELRLQDIAEAKKRKTSSVPDKTAFDTMRHYLYFAKKPNAEQVGELLRSRGFTVEVRKGADGKNWLTLAAKAAPLNGEQMDQLRDEMEAIASQFGGEYDGWETAIDLPGETIN